MDKIAVRCKQCGAEVELTESLAAPLLEEAKSSFNRQLALKDLEIARQNREMNERRAALENAEEALDQTIAIRVAAEAEKVRISEEKKAKASAQLELEGKTNELAETNNRLNSAHQELKISKQAEAEFVKKARELETEKRQFELTIQQKVDGELQKLRQDITSQAEAEVALKLREKDVQLDSMKTEIANLKRKSEQGSQQLQGEVAEQQIVEILSAKFPLDDISRVPKGEYGGDCVQRVYNTQGKLCGTILWESKRTKTWSDAWLEKLKGDQRQAKADVAIIVSQTLPKEVRLFEQLGEIWVTGVDCIVPIAGALRHLLLEVASTKRASEGHQDKASLVYSYVTSVGFRQSIKAITETYDAMQDDLRTEQKAMKKQWAKREAQLEKMVDATMGMYGDLQGIAGNNVPELDGIGFEALGTGS